MPDEPSGLASRSPQMEHSWPARGSMAERHCSQTGRREILMRGVPQRRQSEGKNVANKPAATSPAQQASRLCCPTTLVAVVRIGSSLLLKTLLPRHADATGA